MARSTIHFTLVIVALFLISPAIADFMVLTKDNFENEVGQDRGAFVEFYTGWCGHCKKLAPEFEKLAANFRKTKSILIGQVECDEQKDLCSKNGISSFPSIKWFPKGSLESTKYEGERTAEAMAEYVNQEGGTRVKITSMASNVVELDKNNFDEIVLDKTKDVLVEFHSPVSTKCRSLFHMYETLADAYKNEDGVVIASFDGDKFREITERYYDAVDYPAFRFFPRNNKDGEDYEGENDLESFVEFINEKCGTSRNSQGQLTSTAGMIEDLNKLVKEFMSVDGDVKKEVFVKIEEEAGKLDGSFARYGMIYLKAAQSCMVKGANYARNEIQRLERLLSKSISSGKADEFTLKKNILSAFA